MSLSKSMLTASVLALATAGAGFAQEATLQSAGALAFDTGNVLFVGDGKAGVVHAFDLSNVVADQSGYQLGRAQTFEGRTIINNLDVEIAALLGVNAEEVVINDMVVHKPSRQIFLSVHRGHGPDAEAVIVSVNNGALALVDLAAADHSMQGVGPVPTDGTLEFGQPLNSLAITDIDYYNGELLVAGLSNEEFSSKLRRMPFPFTGAVSTSSIEIWHAVHAQYETRAPIISQTVVDLNGTPTLIAIYACTPIVRIPLAELTDGAEIRGQMIGEMGVLDGAPRSATCTAASDVTVAVLARDDLRRLMEQQPKVAARFLMAMSTRMADRLRETTRKLKSFSQVNRALQQELNVLMDSRMPNTSSVRIK